MRRVWLNQLPLSCRATSHAPLFLSDDRGFSHSRAPSDPAKVTTAALPAKYVVKEVRDIVYRPLAEGEDAAKNKNKLDLYLPEGVHDFPVMLFIHGGAWVFGDKEQFGLYHNLATYWARRGVGVVVANYRLSPGVKHPAHVQDVAKAFAWTKANIAKYGGDVHQLFVSGQSAGGHLVSLLATDESYLKAENAKISDIKGVLTLSGVYGLPASFARGGMAAATGVPAGHDGGQAKRTPFSSVFGSDPKVLKAALADKSHTLGAAPVSRAVCPKRSEGPSGYGGPVRCRPHEKQTKRRFGRGRRVATTSPN